MKIALGLLLVAMVAAVTGVYLVAGRLALGIALLVAAAILGGYSLIGDFESSDPR